MNYRSPEGDENGKYLDHGRLSGIGNLPNVDDVIHPFMTIHGDCNWKVIDVKTLLNDFCFEIYVKDLGFNKV